MNDKWNDDIWLTEQFQTKDALIKRLKEENEKLTNQLIECVEQNQREQEKLVQSVVFANKQLQLANEEITLHENEIRNLRSLLDFEVDTRIKANEDADNLYKWLSHVVDTYDSNGWTVPESWRTALKEHEERIA